MRGLVLVGLISACSSPSSDRRFTAVRSCPVPGLVRSVAAVGTHVVIASEEENVVWDLRLSDCAVMEQWKGLPGPRTLVGVGSGVVSLDVAPSALSYLPFGGAASTTRLDDAGILGVAASRPGAAGSETVIVTLDVDGGAWAELRVDAGQLELTRLTPALGASRVGVADLDGLGALDVIVSHLNDSTLSVFDGRTAALKRTVSPCGDPWALGPTPDGGVLVTCRTEGVWWLGRSPAALKGPAGTVLYDSVVEDLDGDGVLDVASVDPFAHRLLVWWSANGQPDLVPVAKGPVALRPTTVEGRASLLLVSLEERSVVLLTTGRAQ